MIFKSNALQEFLQKTKNIFHELIFLKKNKKAS